MHFIRYGHLDEVARGKSSKDRTPCFVRGEPETNHQVYQNVICLDTVGVEAHQLVDDQVLVSEILLVPMVAFDLVLGYCGTFNLVCGQTQQRLFINDETTSEK